MVNDFSEGFEQYNFAGSNFLPTISIVSMARTKTELEQFFRGDNLDIFEGDDKGQKGDKLEIDLEKVKQYVIPRLKVNTKIDGKSKF